MSSVSCVNDHKRVLCVCRSHDGRPRPYSLALGRRIKQRLWEELQRPVISMMETTGGLLHFREFSSSHTFAPIIDVDVFKEPAPPKLSAFDFQAPPSVTPPTLAQRRPQRDQVSTTCVDLDESATKCCSQMSLLCCRLQSGLSRSLGGHSV